LSYPSWLIIAYLAGLSMIILPCTLPLVFIIIPLSMGKGGKKGLLQIWMKSLSTCF
jgi:cytochrome c-type biogenesis protein